MNWDSEDLSISIGESEKDNQFVEGPIISFCFYNLFFFLLSVWFLLNLQHKQARNIVYIYVNKTIFIRKETNKMKLTLNHETEITSAQPLLNVPHIGSKK